MIEKLIAENIKKMSGYEVPDVKYKIKLDANETPFDLPEKVKKIIVSKIKKMEFNRYPDGQCRALREKISSLYKISIKNILIGNGSDEIIYYLTLLFSKQGKIIYCPPTFAMYSIIPLVCGRKIMPVPLTLDFEIDDKKIIEICKKDKISIIIIGFPNNPTGKCFDYKKVKKIIENVNSVVIVDEAYAEFSGRSFVDKVKKYENLIVLRTFSKAFGLAGLRVGYMFANEKIVKELNKIKLPYNVDLFSQTTAEVCLKNSKYIKNAIEKIISERERLFNKMSKIKGIKVFPSDANFLLFQTEKNSNIVWEELLKKGILIRNLNEPDFKNYMRVTIGTKKENNLFLKYLKQIQN